MKNSIIFEEMCCLHEFHFKIFRSRQISWSICLYKQNLSYHELCAMGLPNIVAIQSNVLNSVSDDVFVLCDKYIFQYNVLPSIRLVNVFTRSTRAYILVMFILMS